MLVSDLSPKEVFSYFKEISDIPRGSGNTDRIAQYCVDFANSHNLLVRRDEADNVVILRMVLRAMKTRSRLYFRDI